jgi:hypothetical protein
MDRRTYTVTFYHLLFFVVVVLTTSPSFAQGTCISLIKGPISFDVEVCRRFDPKLFDTSKPKYKFIDDLDDGGRQQLLDGYRGLVLKGTVVLSQAIKEGISTSKGALQGKKTLVFVPGETLTCESLNQKRITALLNEKCCNGTADAPCLLGNGFALDDVKVTGDAKVGEITTKPPRRVPSKEYQEAETLYAEKKYKDAVKAYLRAEETGELDVKGLYRLGNSYRELERCDLATKPLKKIWDMQQANKIFTEDELDARRGVFLLARCHAKNGDASGAIFYLNAFLLNPKKYSSELRQSLKHKDFGWIHTSKDYQEFKAAAQRKLKGK